MKKIYVFTFPYYKLFFIILIHIMNIYFSFSDIINNIIPLGGLNFRYNHFSLNSKGDMIIDTTAYPGNNERRFFGLKKNGRPYFFDENNNETPYLSLFVNDLENENQQKIEGESNFIILSKQNNNEIKEYLLSFSKFDNYMELYDFENNEIITRKSKEIFGNEITSDVNSFIKSKSKIDNNYNYYFAYIHSLDDAFKFYVLRCYFTSIDLNNNGYHLDTGKRKTTLNKAITSCFETETLKIACYYQKTDKKFVIVAFNETFTSESQGYTYFSEVSDDINSFFKAIHFKKEIGAFAYYSSIDEIYPIISLKYCQHEDNIFYDYKTYGEISLNKVSLNAYAMMNDIIKLNDNKICFISISSDKNSLIIAILNFYDNDNYMMIRYYLYDMYNCYGIKFYNDLRAFSFNNYISVAFSHCPNNICSDYDDEHYSSLIIFNFPNITDDQNSNILEYVYLTNNNFDNFSFILDENISCNIENNIFGYEYQGIKILNYPENTTLIYTNSKIQVEKYTFLIEKENLSLIFETKDEYKGMNYTIEYAYAVKEPDYSKLNNYISYIDNTYGNSFEMYYYEPKEYIGKAAYFNLSIKENLTSYCNDKCILCYESDINYCVICKYNYTFNGDEKICFPNPFIISTIPMTTLLTETSIIISSFLLSSTISSIPLLESTLPLTSSSIISLESTLLSSSTIITFPSSTLLASSTIITLPSSTLLASSSIITFPSSTLLAYSTIITFPSSTFLTEISSSMPIYTTLLSLISSIPTTNNIFENIDTTNIPSNKVASSNPVDNGNLKCTKKEIIDGKCSDIITKEQIEEIYDYIKDNIIKNNNNGNLIIETKNVVFQLSDLEEQANNNFNISSIDLGECEEILKKKENLKDDDELIIFKIDIKNIDLSLTYVQYEIYNPYTLELIPLDICENTPIIIKSPVNLEDELETIYVNMNNSGYNLFNLNDSFYNDICSTYTTQNGTDISMADRKNQIFDNYKNISLCQTGCNFSNYDYENKKAECQCSVQKEETNIDPEKVEFDNLAIIETFYNPLKHSNFLVMKCFKLVFSLEGQLHNIGSYIMSCLCFIFIISFFWYCIRGNKTIDRYILAFVTGKILYSYDKINNYTEINSKQKERKESFKKKSKTIKQTKKLKNFQINNNNININHPNNLNLNKKKRNKKFPPKKRKHISKETLKINESSAFSSQLIKSNITNQTNSRILRDKSLLTKHINKKLAKFKNTHIRKKLTKKINKNDNFYQNHIQNTYYSDIEMERFEYEKAILLDKRTFCQYYGALIKRKQLILFTFLQRKDYNLIQIKICLLIFSISLYFTINGFFFSDSTMNKLYEDGGEYDFFYQLPKLLYSLMLSVFINTCLKKLSLTEKEFLSLKVEKNNIILREKATKARKIVKNRIGIFFILSFLAMIFFWYFISSFCAVYKNTQLILIKDTLISLSFSMIYPFGLYLLPGMFRIPSLKAPKKDKKCVYFIGSIIAMI